MEWSAQFHSLILALPCFNGSQAIRHSHQMGEEAAAAAAAATERGGTGENRKFPRNTRFRLHRAFIIIQFGPWARFSGALVISNFRISGSGEKPDDELADIPFFFFLMICSSFRNRFIQIWGRQNFTYCFYFYCRARSILLSALKLRSF